MKLRPDFGAKEKQDLGTQMSQNNKKLSKGKRDLGMEFYRYTMKELHVYKFVRNLKKKLNESKRKKLENEKQQDKAAYLNIDKNEKKGNISYYA